ncbi:hypothetical protein RFI_16661 [Reticulomyxa filosa]|uniref:Uncharacterized protein n=1 Tax=Reticulomyxa filosa TaxID=46433 RepID=X6N480_RETFI|nr:hypothetical protein RFI_16661 [Reticulomyxa filosa]|eukprot:ETO20559.1 hypothetical protein RFI_16661 [Reticulomyxa filosa]
MYNKYRDIAAVLYESFIGERATNEVNLPSSMRANIKLFFDEKFYEFWKRESEKTPATPSSPLSSISEHETEAKDPEFKFGTNLIQQKKLINKNMPCENKGRLKQQELVEKYLVVFNDAIVEVYGLLQKMYSFEFPRWAEKQLNNWTLEKRTHIVRENVSDHHNGQSFNERGLFYYNNLVPLQLNISKLVNFKTIKKCFNSENILCAHNLKLCKCCNFSRFSKTNSFGYSVIFKKFEKWSIKVKVFNKKYPKN